MRFTMAEQRYRNREIDSFMQQLKTDLSEFRKDVEQRDTIQRGEIQSGFGAITRRQDVQNGKLSRHDMYIYMGLGGLSIIAIIVVPLLGWALYSLSNLDNLVHKSVDEALSAYNIKAQ